MQFEFIITLNWVKTALEGKDKGQYWQKWQSELEKPSKLLPFFAFCPDPINNLVNLPRYSFLLRFSFKLRKPYISKDDGDFHLLDNPIRKDKVFKTPMVAATSWKGALRSAMMRLLVKELHAGRIQDSEFIEYRLQLYRLFGNEKDGTAEFLNRAFVRKKIPPLAKNADAEEKKKWRQRFEEALKEADETFEQYLREKKYRVGEIEGFQGRFRFFPTFFDKVKLEVINPHDRKTGVGARGPILMECVPPGTEGELFLLYVPLGVAEQDEASLRAEVAADLAAVAEGVRAMLTKYGFGAKTSSGFGVAGEKLLKKGKLAINIPVKKSAPPNKFRALLNEEGRPIEVLLDSSGKLLKKSQLRKLGDRKPANLTNAEFEEFKKWYEEHGEAIAKGFVIACFDSFSELVQRAQAIAGELKENRQ